MRNGIRRLREVRRSLRPLALASVLGGFVVFALGCSSLAPLEPLGVNLVNLDVEEITLFEATMVAKVRISNPNPEPLQFSGGALKLLIDDRKIGTAMTPEAFSVEGFTSTVIDMTVHVNTASAIARIPKLIEKKSVSYGVRGALYSQSSFGTRKHLVERVGSLDLAALDEGDRVETAPPAPS
jgi:LEA14-like dessication related protein